jgi:hypothetical protein
LTRTRSETTSVGETGPPETGLVKPISRPPVYAPDVSGPDQEWPTRCGVCGFWRLPNAACMCGLRAGESATGGETEA